MLGLSRAYGDLSEWLKSLESARKALTLNISSHDAAFWVGYSLQNLGREQDAVNAYREALNVSPVAAQTHLYLASALENLGEEENALKHYEMATIINPDFIRLLLVRALLQRCGDINLAIDKFRQVAESNPLLADAHLALGSSFQKGESKGAIESYQKAVEINPELTDAYFTLGDSLKARGKVDETRKVVTALQHLNSIDSNTLVSLQDKTLVFDWHQRRTLDLSWRVELDIAFSRIDSSTPSACLEAIRQLNAHFYTPLFMTHKNTVEETRLLYKNGFLIEEDLVSPDICSGMIKEYSGEEPIASS